MALPISIEQLLGSGVVESSRIEYKEGWNPDAIYRTICAFANDFDNIGGGYIVVGVEEKNGRAVRPVKGLDIEKIEPIEKDMIGFNNLIKPLYVPKTSIEDIDVETKSEVRRMVEKFVDDNPDAAAALLRNWLSDDWG